MNRLPEKGQWVFFLFAVVSILLLLSGDSIGGVMAGRYGYDDYAPQVRIISPVQETIDLGKTGGVLFKWSWIEGNRMERQYYDFRIYKGYDMLESTLIYKIQTPPDSDRLFVKAEIFPESGTYTWSIRQRYYGMAKSRRNYASFAVIKR